MSKKKDEQNKPHPKEAPEEINSSEAVCDSELETNEYPDLKKVGELILEIESLKDGISELNDRYLRLRAEYDNFRKRSAKERESAFSDAICDVVSSLLPVFDNLERALCAPTQDTAFLKGVEMTMKQFTQCFEKLGVCEIPALGETFDPEFHEAVMHVEDKALDENKVAEVFQKGFKTGDRIIRHAMVKVAN